MGVINVKNINESYFQLPILYCQAIDFFDKLEELHIGQVLIVNRYSKEKKDIINEVWIKLDDTTYRNIGV